MKYLRHATAVTEKAGPFLDETDGVTPLTALTIAAVDLRLSKNGGDMGPASATQGTSDAAPHDEIGVYDISFDTSDTNTLGRLRLDAQITGALPVWQEYAVLPQNVYDGLIADTDLLQVDIAEILGAIPDPNTPADTNVVSVQAAAIDDAAFAADTDKFQAKISLFHDAVGSEDHYVAVWYKNGEPLVSGVTDPTIQVYRVANGVDLIQDTSMTEIGVTGTFRYTEATNRITAGVGYFAKVSATIAAATKTWYQPIGRDTTV